MDILNPKIDERLVSRLVFGLRKHETHAGAIEEREIADREKVIQVEHIAIPPFGFLDVGNRASNLPYSEKSEFVIHWRNLRSHHTVAGSTYPPCQCATIPHAKRRSCIRNVILDDIKAYAPPIGNFPIGKPMPCGIKVTPL
jgi:hypothetical protein